MKKRRWTVTAIAILIAVGAAAGAWWWTQHRAAAGGVVLYGDIDIREVELAFDASERITAINVQEGDQVKKGEVLATVDTRHLGAQIDAAQAAVAAQQATVDKLHAGNRPEEIAQAQANLDAASSDAELAGEGYRRASALAASPGGSPAISQAQIDTAKSTLDVANAKVQVAQKALDLEKAGPRKEDVAQAEAVLAQSRAQLELLDREESDARLIAPTDGIVLSRLAEPGEMVTPQRPVLSLAIVNPKWVRAYVSESDLGRVHPGARASISVDSFPGKPFPGWVGFISPVAEFTPKSVETSELRSSLVYEVRIFVDDPTDSLRLGMPATVQLLTNDSAPAAGQSE